MFILMHNGLGLRTQMVMPYHRPLPTQHHCALLHISSSQWLHGNYVFSSLLVTVIVSLTLISVAPKGIILETVVIHFQCILFI